jgi:tryptophan synthase alpha chain
MNKVSQKLQAARQSGEKLLSIFVTAGFPERDSTPELVWTLEQAGADLIEIGIPFSDPIADGATIQHASQVALQNGMSLQLVLRQVEIIRSKSQIPLILMGYLNPIVRHGFAETARDAEAAGVDGFIIPDLIPEEFVEYRQILTGRSIGVNFLVSPNTPTARLREIDELTSDFIYCVSLTGVTGSRAALPSGIVDYLGRVKQNCSHPYLVGFGISTPEVAKAIARHSDGVIIGSALLKVIAEAKDSQDMHHKTATFTRNIKTALKGA